MMTMAGMGVRMLAWACATALLLCLVEGAAQSRTLGLGSRHLQQVGCDQSTYPALQPTITRAPVIDLQWLDKNDQNVLAITKKVGLDAGGLWLSTDGGKRWAEQTAMLNASLPSTESVEVVGVFAQKSNPSNVLILGAGTWYWTSNDYAKTFTARQTPSKWRGMSIKSYKLHPIRDDWLLILVKRPDCKALDRAQMECPHDLMYSPNMFSGDPTWVNLTESANGKIAGFVDFDWARNLCPDGNCHTMMKVKDETILATMYVHAGDYDQAWDPDVHFVSSDEWFKKFSTQVRCGNMFEIIGKSVYLAMANSCPTDINGHQRSDSPTFPQGITLYTSQDGGCMFTQACLPVAIKQEGYELLETHDGTGAIVIVDYIVNNNLPASSVYTAGPHHALFSLSLTDVYHADYGFSTDFAKIEGLPGVYISNQMLARPDSSQSDYYDLNDATGQPLVETRMSFNGGGRWQRIPAPATFNFPLCNRCDGQAECSLHLHGMSSWDSMMLSLPAVYSNPSAPGLIMASGNTGIKGVGLDDNDGLCTWLSTDGGVTWSDVAMGAYIYEYADWGGFIVMARHPGRTDKAADEVLFSYDGGKCWQRVPLSEAVLLDNIRIEPDGQRPRVIVHGRRCRKSVSNLCAYDAEAPRQGVLEGAMYLVDVQDLMSSKMGMCAASDRERWGVPAEPGSANARCILGRQSFIERRKWSANCLNGPSYLRPLANTMPCNCTPEADLECDYGYLRSGARCVKLTGSRMPTCPAMDELNYHVSSTGLRLVHADTCSGVEALLPDTNGQGEYQPSVDGGGGGGSSGHSGWFWFFIFLLITIGLTCGFVGWWIYLATESQRDSVRDLAASAAESASNVKHWVSDKVGGRRNTTAEHDLGYFQPLGDDGADEHRSLFTLK